MNTLPYKIGLDIGAVSAKLVIVAPGTDPSVFPAQYRESVRTLDIPGQSPQQVLFAGSLRTQGEVIPAAETLLEAYPFLKNTSVLMAVTGSQGKLAARYFNVPLINEFKSIALGSGVTHPEARSIIEIGGDKSRYLRIQPDVRNGSVSILEFERNGDCAAGTGSFIDQQAERLGVPVEEIGDMVLQAENAANIAGRCSVFAKSDMIHAQQRGFSPAAVFKGLCQAVVRNYKGTVLRGKMLEPGVVFTGGLAMNAGVVEAVRDIFALQDLIIPEFPMHMTALGCALDPGVQPVDLSARREAVVAASSDYAPKLGMNNVVINKEDRFTSSHPAEQSRRAWLGLDVGSVSTNLVLLDEENRVIDSVYTRTEGKPVQVLQREFADWHRKWSGILDIVGVGATGSGRELAGELVGADVVRDEITAHKTGACMISNTLGFGQVDTILEIGGQDSKFISIQDDIVIDFTMNEACAAGTGSFLEEQAIKMGIAIKNEFSRLALESGNPIKMGERCTVFMEKDVTSFLQQGYGKQEICAGLAYAVAHNYINRVVRDRKIGDVIFFQGGTAYNHSVAAAMSAVLGKRIIVPPFNGIMGAIGAALLSRQYQEQTGIETRFRGFDLSQVEFRIRNIRCKACSNQCDVQECTVNGEKTYWGDKCSDRYRKRSKSLRKPVIPDLVEQYNGLLTGELPGPDGLGIRIGIPKSMYYFDRYPFWSTYFSHLGAEIVLSETTNKRLVKNGRELTIADPCFPIIAAHGHMVDLAEKSVDYIFAPNAVNTETEFPEKQSWLCPWGQTLPYVVQASIYDQKLLEKLLIPVIRFRNGEEYIKRTMRPIAKKLGVSARQSDQAIDLAYAAQKHFRQQIRMTGDKAIRELERTGQQGVVLLGRPYNIYDAGVNLGIPDKLREQYGVNLIPLDFLPLEHVEISHVHENMFWNYGKRILQAATWAGRHKHLSVIYLTNFKCGPDSYIKHFAGNAVGSPILVLQVDEHSNDAGAMTRCEAFLASKGMLDPVTTPVSVSEMMAGR